MGTPRKASQISDEELNYARNELQRREKKLVDYFGPAPIRRVYFSAVLLILSEELLAVEIRRSTDKTVSGLLSSCIF